MTRLLIPIGLAIGTMANGAPCYTDLKDGCNGSTTAIYVKTENTENGLCTEYINEQQQKIIRCHTNSPTPIEKKTEEKIVVNTQNVQPQPPPPPVIYNNQIQQINNYNNNLDNIDDYRDNNTNYWGGYWNSYYNNNHFGGGFYPHRPPPQHNRPQKKPPIITMPAIPSGKKTNGRSAAVPAPRYNPSNKPNHPRSPRGDMFDQPSRSSIPSRK